MEPFVGAYGGGGIVDIPGILAGKVRALYDIHLSPYIIVCTGSSSCRRQIQSIPCANRPIIAVQQRRHAAEDDGLAGRKFPACTYGRMALGRSWSIQGPHGF